MKKMIFILLMFCTVLNLTGCGDDIDSVSEVSSYTSTTAKISKDPVCDVNDLAGMWTCSHGNGFVSYLRIGSEGVFYWYGKTAPTESELSDPYYKIGGPFIKLYVNGSGDTVCEFDKYTCTVISSTRLEFRGETYSKK